MFILRDDFIIYLYRGYFNFNGKIFKEDAAIIGPGNRGLRYGDGLVETMKCVNGTILFEDEHFARLWKGMQILQFDKLKHFTPSVLSEQIQELVQKNSLQKYVRIRVQVFKGDGGLYDAKNNFPNYVIQVWELAEGNESLNNNGLITGIYRDVRKSCDAISNIKHSNYLPYAMAALHAKKEKWNDAIILNSASNICDSTIANVFIIKDGILKTPALQEGCIAGVMRKNIIKKLLAAGWIIEETSITENELKSADEIFLCNVIYNIRWVKQIDEVEFVNISIPKIYAELFDN
ncbi:MAG: aminotransferase class IV [Chitinophagaceae bacterium]|nr:aminotransferase class IV [Chitinophagaceae bacterium]